MNVKRRRKLEQIREQLSDLVLQLEEIRDEEQEGYDNMPESLQQGEKGEKMQTAISEIEDVINDMQYADDHLNTAME